MAAAYLGIRKRGGSAVILREQSGAGAASYRLSEYRLPERETGGNIGIRILYQLSQDMEDDSGNSAGRTG